MKFLRDITTTCIIVCLFFLFSTNIFAQEQTESQNETYTVDYDFQYFIENDSTSVDVELDITITNLRSDVYVTEYTMRFPKNFILKNLIVGGDNDKQIPYVVAEKENARELTFRFGEPEGGAYTMNHLRLSYTLDDMHTPKGRINEVILPLLVSTHNNKVRATLHLPENFNKQISISKPAPTSVEFRKIHWENVEVRTIFALFGESQVYDVELSYSLQNTGIRSSIQTVALPPETLFQKIYVSELRPRPKRTYTDDDGNFLAEYELSPRSSIDINFKGYVEVFVKPQSTLRDHIRAAYAQQKHYLLTEEQQWSLGDKLSILHAHTFENAREIYTYVIDQLDYSFTRLRTDASRYGAEKALSEPTKAVCMEFTDLFIAIAREEGIPSREIQGYGYSESQRIRPQSLVQDVLHAWPEFYNEAQEVWTQVDPTWEDTSGIDYFSGFDVNHIALAIHGKDPLEPLPAGFYKTEPSKDVHVKISSLKPSANIHVDISHNINKTLQVGKRYTSTVYITNTGNSFIHEIFIIPDSKNITFHTDALQVSYLAPFETRNISIEYTPTENYNESDVISFTYDGSVLGSHDVRIIESTNHYVTIALVFGTATLVLFTIYLFLKKRNS